MPRAIEVLSSEQWVPVQGALIHVQGTRFRAIVTNTIGIFPALVGGTPRVRINGRQAHDVTWSFPPEESVHRGYVSFELTLDPNDS